MPAWQASGQPIQETLSAIEATALDVFARYNLPVRPGNYARSQKTDEWRFLSEHLTAEERWEIALAQKNESSWRFGLLHELADQHGIDPDLRQAVQALRSCKNLRMALATTRAAGFGETLEMAVRLGSAWRDLKVVLSQHARQNEPLELTVLPAQPRKRKARAKSKASKTVD